MTATWVSGPGRGANPGPLTPASCNLHRKKRTTGLSHTAGPGSSARRPSLALGSDAGAARCNGSAVRRCAAAPGPGDATPGPQPGPCFAGKPDPRADRLSRGAPGKDAPRPSAYRKTPTTLPALPTSTSDPDRTWGGCALALCPGGS